VLKNSVLLRYLLTTLAVLTPEVVIISQPANAISSNLIVMIEGLRSKQGQVCARLFSQSDGFPDRQDKAVANRCIKVDKIAAGFKFDNLAPGSYAVAIFHDANSDNKLNTGVFGIPSEGLGCSRNPRGLVGPPRFQDAVFLVVGPNNEIKIQLNYL
jgi:uncharacterized protein (DUF2141 family)